MALHAERQLRQRGPTTKYGLAPFGRTFNEALNVIDEITARRADRWLPATSSQQPTANSRQHSRRQLLIKTDHLWWVSVEVSPIPSPSSCRLTIIVSQHRRLRHAAALARVTAQ